MERSAAPTVSVVIPAKNEAANLNEILPTLSTDYELVLVDGNSTDDTVAVAQRHRPDIKLVRQTRKGKGNALHAGFLVATGDIIVMFDADGSADAGEIPQFVDALAKGADFARGTRFAKGGGSKDITPLRSFGNFGLNLAANIGFGMRSTDLCYGYMAFWRDLVPVLGLPSVDIKAAEGEMLWGDGFEVEALINCRVVRAGGKVVEVGSVEHLRRHGESNLNTWGDGFRVLRTLWTEFLAARRAARGPALEARTWPTPRTDLLVAAPLPASPMVQLAGLQAPASLASMSEVSDSEWDQLLAEPVELAETARSSA